MVVDNIDMVTSVRAFCRGQLRYVAGSVHVCNQDVYVGDNVAHGQ